MRPLLRLHRATNLGQQHEHTDDYHDTDYRRNQTEHGRRSCAPIGGRLGSNYLVGNTNRNCAEQAGD